MARRKTRAKKPKDAVYDPVSTALGMTDVLERVLTFVEKPADVVKSALVSKAFRKVCNSTALWKARAAHHKPVSQHTVVRRRTVEYRGISCNPIWLNLRVGKALTRMLVRSSVDVPL
jgi:hypothetical protein